MSITFAGDRMRVAFDRFDLDAYGLFLRCKALPEYDVTFDRERETYEISAPSRFAPLLGVPTPAAEAAPLPYCDVMYDDQRVLVTQALTAKRFAIWSQCGNGKTLMGLEFARQVAARTRGRVLITTLYEIVPQWIEEAARFYGDALPLPRLETREAMREWCASGPPGLAITNYEKFNHRGLAEQVVNELRHLAGVVLDESSRLKTGGGKQKWALVKSTKGIEYKLSLTATPAPNDTIEFASQAAFLEKMRTDADILWTFFTRNPETTKWEVKPHARRAFFEFMASWSVYVNDPRRYGWRLDQPVVPAPTYKVIDVALTPEQRNWMHRLTVDDVTGQSDLFGGSSKGAVRRLQLSQLAKGFIYRKDADKKRRTITVDAGKPSAVACLVSDELQAGEQVLIWTVFDAESALLYERLKLRDGVALLTGATPDDERLRILHAFRRGEVRVLISRPRMLGYGLNFQHCGAMIFSGWTDSFEDLYQAIRRAVRHGQRKSVRVYFPIVRELEGDVFDNVRRKEAEFERAIADMEANYIRASQRLRGAS